MFSANSSQVSSAANYIEDVFSTYLYTGTGSALTITNGIDLSTYGGLVWLKPRNANENHYLTDTARGNIYQLSTNTTQAQDALDGLTFLSNGVTIPYSFTTAGNTYVSWTFRKQPKFFDVVTYTGNGSNRTIAHNLGSVPGCIIVKRTDTTGAWAVYHRSLANTEYAVLNTTAAKATGATYWNSTTATATDFSLGTATDVNANTGTYVAYLFAHNAGGFGLTGTDNVISCGSYTGNGFATGPTVTLGYEPQYVMVKNASGVGNWAIVDVMRGFTVGGTDAMLYANTSGATDDGTTIYPTATGFGIETTNSYWNSNGSTYIYIAIRRGPMKTPTSGTSVFSPVTANAAAGTAQTTGFVVDSQWKAKRATDTLNTSIDDRLRGVSTTSTASGNYLITSSTAAEATTNATTQAWNNTGFQISTYYASASDVFWNFARAPGFFDEVCYTGTGSATTQAHNLGVAPEFMIVKCRNESYLQWYIYHKDVNKQYVWGLESNAAPINYGSPGCWNNTAPTSSVFSLSEAGWGVNNSGDTHVAYLFASCPGVSKVGSYTGTGTGTTKQIDCGFTGGARFVLIKRTDDTGDWYVWDSARGIVAGNDPYLLLNSTAAEVASTDYIDPYSAGFELSSTAPAALNANGGTYIYLAIA